MAAPRRMRPGIVPLRANFLMRSRSTRSNNSKCFLAAEPDIVLLDNMTPETLREAVALRDAAGSAARLESSGGVNLKTIRAIALSGVDRISVGALTHSARSLDIGLDWV